MTNKSKRGFTLAEMLIVIAIIGILVAIVSVKLSDYLERSREAVDMANIRQAYSLLQNALIDDTIVDTSTKFTSSSSAKKAIGKVLVGTKSGKKYYVTAVKLKQKIAEWQSIPSRPGLMIGNEQFWLTTNPNTSNCFYFCIDMTGFVDKTAFWGMVKVN